MSGYLFILCIPTEKHESDLEDKKNDNTAEHIIGNDHIKSTNTTIKHVAKSDNSLDNVDIDVDKLNEWTKRSSSLGAIPTSKPHVSMKVMIEETLKDFGNTQATWQLVENNQYYQIVFPVEDEYDRDRLLDIFNQFGFGSQLNSWISVVPCELIKKSKNDVDESDNKEELFSKDQSAWDKFLNSVRARLNVAHIVEEVTESATITFDFLTLLIVAGILAAFGLIEDSTIFLASSMLISPLMGPIIAATFGSVIKDYKLAKLGIVNELIGISLATVVGFFFGLIVCSIDGRYGIGEGLTNEMLSRCELHALLVGVLTAIPSGAAVAISILGDNIGSLVGVAISASLLPPAVNSGLLWAIAMLFLLHEKDEFSYNKVTKTAYYSNHQAAELAILGSISMTITIINVICIYMMGFLFLKIKEVAPMASKQQRQFWKYDVKVARDYNKTYNQTDGDALKNDIENELAELQASNSNTCRFNAKLLKNIGRSTYQNTWSPMSLYSNKPGPSRSIHYLQELFYNMANKENDASRMRNTVMTISPKLKNQSHEDVRLKIDRRASMPFFKLDNSSLPKPGYMTQISEVSPSYSSYKRKSETEERLVPPKKFTVTIAEERQN